MQIVPARNNMLRNRLLIFLTAFAARALLLILVEVRSIDVFRWSADSWEYIASMMAIRDGNWNFYMFIYRTPAYPFLLRTFLGIFNLQPPQMKVWLPFQAVLTALGVVFAYHVIYRLFRNRTLALLAGLVLAVFPANLAGETPILTEALFNITLVVAILFLLRWLSNQRWRDFIALLLALDLMVLTRPTGEFVVAIFVAVIAFYNWRLLRYVPLLIAGFIVPIVLWTAHNYAAFGINTYSSASTYAFLFYKAVSTETMVTGQSPEDIAWNYSRIIEDRIGNPPRSDSKTFPVGNYDYLYVTNPDRYKAMAALASEKLWQYNVLHLVKMPYVFLRQFFTYETLEPFLSLPERVIISLTFIGLFVVGLWQWLRQKRLLWQYVLILGALGYFLGGPAPFASYNLRYTSNISVFLVPFIAIGLQQLQHVFKRKGAPGKALQAQK